MTKPFDRLRGGRIKSPIEKENIFNRNKGVINRVVMKRLGKTKRIVHGGRAQNAQLPRHLERRPTIDWDVFAKNPEIAAARMERALDKKFRGDFFGVKEGATKELRVRKVISKISGESFVDFSVPDRDIPWVAKRGIRYAGLKDQFERAKQNVKDPEKTFRLEKDKSLINRIRKFEKLRGKKIR